MNLYLVRHGIAVDIGEQGVKRDADRMLSAEGAEKTRLAGGGLKRAGCRPERILASPRVRSHQTADILQSVLAPRVRVEVCRELDMATPLSRMLKWAESLEGESIMLVGHMPDVAVLASALVANGPLAVHFRKAATMCIRFEGEPRAHHGIMEWFLPPAVLRALAKA